LGQKFLANSRAGRALGSPLEDLFSMAYIYKGLDMVAFLLKSS